MLGYNNNTDPNSDQELCQGAEPINVICDTVWDHKLDWYQLPLSIRISDNHHIGGNKTDLNLTGWQHELGFETDCDLRNYLDKGVREGFKIIDNDVKISEYECTNYNSVLQGESHDCIDKLIKKEIQGGKYIATDIKPYTVHA